MLMKTTQLVLLLENYLMIFYSYTIHQNEKTQNLIQHD